MWEFRNHSLHQHHGNNNGPPAGLGSCFQGSVFGCGDSASDYQGHGNHSGHNQQSGQGNQQQNNQSGYQSNPKQLYGGKYHVFTTNTCKSDRKVHKR